MNYRNRRLLDLAHRINECQIRMETVCTGYCVDGCVPAHSDSQRHGKGVAIKAEDFFFAAGCAARNSALSHSADFSRETKQGYWQRGFERTLKILWENGWIKVA